MIGCSVALHNSDWPAPDIGAQLHAAADADSEAEGAALALRAQQHGDHVVVAGDLLDGKRVALAVAQRHHLARGDGERVIRDAR